MNAPVKYLQHHEIDRTQWDACITNAYNGAIYGYSFYLDHMARQWDGLIMGNYQAVLALPWNKKYGIHYAYQPPFTACCGAFGNELNEDVVNDLIRSIPKKFRLVEISLDARNIFSFPSGFEHLRSNYVLALNSPYETIYSNYRQNAKRNIKKAIEVGCRVQSNIAVQDIISIARSQLETVVGLSAHDWQQFEKLYQLLHSRQQAITYGVFGAGNELLASAVFFFSHKRAYYILVGNHPNGKTLGASHYLIDRFIFDHAGKDILLDFEGSDIRSLAFFYSSFGAREEVYPALKLNRLPALLKWLK